MRVVRGAKCLDGRTAHTDLVELITPYAKGLDLGSFAGRMVVKMYIARMRFTSVADSECLIVQ